MVKGLKEFREAKAAEEARKEEARKPSIQRFTLKNDGDSAIVRFAQEIDFDAKNFSEARGIGFVNIYHDARSIDSNNGWKNSGNCSVESQGDCWPCNKAKDYAVEWDKRKGWRGKEKFYINLVAGEPREEVEGDKKKYYTTDINRTTGDGTVYLLEQSTHNGIYDSLADYFLEEEVSNGTITDKFFKITRKGSKFNDTSYSITPLKELPKAAKSLDDFELYDIKEDVLTEVPVAQQEAFYHRGVSVAADGGDTPPFEGGTNTGAGSTSTDESW